MELLEIATPVFINKCCIFVIINSKNIINMNVKLYRQDEADYTIDENKCEKISYKTLCMLTDYKECHEDSSLPKMVVFKTKEDFQKDAWRYDIDSDKEILINSKGSIFCYLKDGLGTSEKSENKDVTTNPDKN